MKVIKIIKYLYLSVVLICIVFLGIFLSSTLFSETGYAQVFGYSFFEVQSYSMYPELEKGDLVVVKKRDNDEYKEGMVITYKRPGDSIPTTHKIVNIDGNIITTKGINESENTTEDEPFEVTYVIGEVVKVWEDYDKTREFITNPIGIIIIVLFGLFLFEGISFFEKEFSNKE